MAVGILDNASGLRVLNGAAQATLYDASGNALFAAENDAPSTVKGLVGMGVNDRSALPVRMDRMGSVASALHTPLYIESFEGATINPLRWLSTATTMAATQSSVAGLTLNSGAITTINTGIMQSSPKRFLKSQRSPIQSKWRARFGKVNNSVMELGFGDASTFNGAHTTGAYWQAQSGGAIVPVLTFNSVDLTGTDVSGSIDPTKYYTWDVILDDDEAIFVVQDTATGLILNKQSIKLPLTQQRLWSSTAMPIFCRLYNTGVAPASAPVMIATDCYVLGLDANLNKPWAHVLAGMERGSNANPLTGAQLAQWGNSADPTSATLSNTAAGYTTLGGRFQFAMVAGAATDYALFGFQVPSPANLVITDLAISLWNTGAANAATPSRFEFAVAVGSTAVSLATATVSRRALGAIGLASSAAIGAMGDRDLVRRFNTPLFCAAGRFAHIILRCPVPNAATASQVIQGIVDVGGYFE